MLCDQMVFPRFALSLKTAQGGSTHLNFKTIWNVGLTQCFPTFKGYRAPPIQTEVYFLILICKYFNLRGTKDADRAIQKYL